MSTDDKPRSDRLFTDRTDENVQKILDIILEDRDGPLKKLRSCRGNLQFN